MIGWLRRHRVWWYGFIGQPVPQADNDPAVDWLLDTFDEAVHGQGVSSRNRVIHGGAAELPSPRNQGGYYIPPPPR